MRLHVILPVCLVGLGCQGTAPLLQQRPAGPTNPPVATVAHRTPGGSEIEQGPDGSTVVRTRALVPAPGLPDWPQPPPSGQSGDLVPARVVTTTTYRHHCKLEMDSCQLRLPFPHLRIFTGPDKVVTQTEYIRNASTEPVAVKVPGPTRPSILAATPAPPLPPQRTAKLPRVQSRESAVPTSSLPALPLPSPVDPPEWVRHDLPSRLPSPVPPARPGPAAPVVPGVKQDVLLPPLRR